MAQQDAPPSVPTDALCWYYSKHYPHNVLWRMLSGAPMANRQIALTYTGEDGNEHMRRHESFESVSAFRKHMETRKPSRIDIGGAYLIRPSHVRLFTCEPSADDIVPPTMDIGYKEVAFDIDIDAYDTKPKRTCCTGRGVCGACWPIVMFGCIAIDAALRYNLQAKHLMWFFSGGRGMHCWVADRELCTADGPTRSMLLSHVLPAHNHVVSMYEESFDTTCTMMLGILLGCAPLVMLGVKDHNCASVVSTCTELLKEIELMTPSLSDGTGNRYCRCTSDTNDRCPLHVPYGMFLGWYALYHPESALDALRKSITKHLVVATEKDVRDHLSEFKREIDAVFDAHHVAKTSEMLADIRQMCSGKVIVNLRTLYDGWDDDSCEIASVKAVDAVIKSLSTTLHDPSFITSANPAAHIEMIRAVADAALDCMAPRLDENVTTHLDHLLKAPLSVHPLTGRLACPVMQNEFATFYPASVPRLITTSADEQTKTYGFEDPVYFSRAIKQFDDWVGTLPLWTAQNDLVD